ncbi:RNA polymerase subunit sigma-24 [Caulobacter sp. Root1455]|uniref:RNA polymerase sigma factor n=1 Tax=unclassified Caulobacter TaxID=2648921 RepID=UPI0006F8C78F|nr:MULTISPECIES: RNA polymerase sigma factor [unclassified Caulobacter]KQY28101.1 RNA polymerase subunit sigma-24 [Caulobacter sp. Root487D2Y]KQZ04737.1 RNA polymerase subunit sigma-24 [Caulobacter sp. Root1455]
MARLYGEKRANLVRVFAAKLRSVSEAEDLIQDLFLKVQALGDLEVEGDGSALLFRMANNLMLDRLRGQTRASARDGGWRNLQGEVLGDQQVADIPSAEAVVAGRQRLRAMMAALDSLPPQVARAFKLHKLEGLSHAETAAVMGVSRSSVEKHISAALKALTARLP